MVCPHIQWYTHTEKGMSTHTKAFIYTLQWYTHSHQGMSTHTKAFIYTLQWYTHSHKGMSTHTKAFIYTLQWHTHSHKGMSLISKILHHVYVFYAKDMCLSCDVWLDLVCEVKYPCFPTSWMLCTTSSFS